MRKFETPRFSPVRILQISVACLSVALIGLVALTVPRYGRLEHTSGVWIATAYDLLKGDFWRPLLGDAGYGGSRYFPLHVLLHAAFMRLWGHPVLSGHLVSFFSLAGLIYGLYRLLGKLGVRKEYALPLAFAVLSSASLRLALLSIRSDLLPAAFNIWGLVFFMEASDKDAGKRSLPLASLCFILAFLSKITTVFGFAAALLTCVLSGRRKAAWELWWTTVFGMALTLALTQWASDGRFLKVLQACWSSGAGWSDVLWAPGRTAFFMSTDPVSLFLFFFALAILLYLKNIRLQLPALLLAMTHFVTVAIFCTPGTVSNHLLDIHLATLIFIAAQIPQEELPAPFLTSIISVAAFSATFVILLECGGSISNRYNINELGNLRNRLAYERVIQDLGTLDKPILAQNPMLPVLAGKRPYMLDPFMFQVLSRRHPEMKKDFMDRLGSHFFPAIVLTIDPDRQEDRANLDEVFFGPGFVDQLLANYHLASRQENLLVYRPNERHPSVTSPGRPVSAQTPGSNRRKAASSSAPDPSRRP